MMQNIPEKYRTRIDSLIKLIGIKSKLLSEFGNEVTIKLNDYLGDFDSDLYEISFVVNINTTIECVDCFHNPKEIIDIVNEFADRIYKGASFYLGNDLIARGTGSSLRGVTIDKFNFMYGDVSDIQLTIYYDINQSF